MTKPKPVVCQLCGKTFRNGAERVAHYAPRDRAKPAAQVKWCENLFGGSGVAAEVTDRPPQLY